MSAPVEQPSPPASKSHRRRWIAVLAAVVVVVAGVLTAVLLRSGPGEREASPGSPPGTTESTPAPVVPVPSSPPAPPPSSSRSLPVPGFGFPPLWPFTGTADALAWQQSYRSGGHQPWHLDAGSTAQSFTQGYLGYQNVDLVTETTVHGREAWVGVGYRNPSGTPSTAGVIHLAKLGSGTDAPWEVVGTRDTLLTLTQPRYGAMVASPVTVGGRVTGVDENLVTQIRESRLGLVGQAPGVPAGGQNTPWSVRVSFRAPVGSVLTIAVATGGHVTDVERFAVTAVVAG
ncbi:MULTISPECIES: hypothetical protein [Amycolatopsis]|uniref:Uncharacterized protein n=2 Tax=Amycolatopsis TaxID=1813 RepID=A0A1I3L163_9PSEU|nr:hypothetical protein [Amycolatopsis sacchari]SFI78431.1 hypothetical protein SAMN05421835_101775 [Amycolatopsis sacchari]